MSTVTPKVEVIQERWRPSEEQADARFSEAGKLPNGEARENALRNAAQLRVNAFMKRALTLQSTKSK
jgi:hypothetical protein